MHDFPDGLFTVLPRVSPLAWQARLPLKIEFI